MTGAEPEGAVGCIAERLAPVAALLEYFSKASVHSKVSRVVYTFAVRIGFLFCPACAFLSCRFSVDF